MTWPAEEVLSFVAPRVPDAVVSSGALGRIASLAQRLPLDWTSYYIECRLDRDASQIDFLAGLSQRDAQTVLGHLDQSRLADLPGRVHWNRFRALLNDWLNGSSRLRQQVPAVWIELDHAGNRDPAEVTPSFCVCVAHDYACSAVLAPQSEDAFDALLRALEHLLPEGANLATANCLWRTVAALNESCQLIHLSVMTARSPLAMKLYVSVPRTQLTKFGERAGCPEILKRVANIVRDLGVDMDPIYLDLTIEESIAPRIGIAFSQYHRGAPDFDPSWGSLLSACVERGICSQNKCRALVDWAGRERVQFTNTSFAARLDRYLDVKLVSTETSLQAKAYLGFQAKAALF